MKEFSENRIAKANDFGIEKIQQLLQSTFQVRYDQMLIDTNIKRKNVCFVRYQAKTLNRTVKIIKFPLYQDIKSQFLSNFSGGESVHGKIKRMSNSSILNSLSGRSGVIIENFSELDNQQLAFYDLPVEMTHGVIQNNQPHYFIPSLTYSFICHNCNGEKYITCPDYICQGRHEWTCTNCHGDRDIECNDCNGRGENTCSKCHGHGEYTCPTCNGLGTRRCPVCKGTGMREYVENLKTYKERCSNCYGKGEAVCSRSTSAYTLVGKLAQGVIHEYCDGKGVITCGKCEGKGVITCGKCDGRGRVTCPECNGNGTIVCSVCYGDSERYGKVDCDTCMTVGEMGEIVYIETVIEDHDTESMFTFGELIPNEGFSIDILKKYINSNYQISEVYYCVRSESGNEVLHENYDSFSVDICKVRENTLGIYKNKYPKVLIESIYYEAVPCITLQYNHFLTNTEHAVSFISTDLPNPLVIFHSNPANIDVRKLTFTEILKANFSKAFTTNKYQNKINKLNEVRLLIHMVKASSQISQNKKKVIAGNIQHLDELSQDEKKELFNLMASQHLPELVKKQCIFSSREKATEVQKKLEELAAADGIIEDSEKVMLDDLIRRIKKAGHFSFFKKLGNFFKTWKVSLPIGVLLLFIIFSIYAYFNLWPTIQQKFFQETNKEAVESNIPEEKTKSNVLGINSKDDLIAYYLFDGNALDQSGNQNNGICNFVEFIEDRNGNISSAISFNGHNSSVSIPPNGLLNLTDNFSIVFWIKFYSSNNNHHIIVKGDNSTREYSITGVNNKIQFNKQCEQGIVESLTTLELNKWYFVAITYSNFIGKIYINGKYESEGRLKSGFQAANSGLTIGTFPNSTGSWTLNGALDELRFYKRVLSEDEIDRLNKINIGGYSKLPDRVGYVNDFEGILSVEQISDLNNIITENEKKTTDEIIIVTTKSFDPYTTFKDYALELSKYWGIGKKDKNNGVLIVLSKQLNQTSILIGNGLVEKLSSEKAHIILESKIIPEFKNDNYYGGIKNGVLEILNECTSVTNKESIEQPKMEGPIYQLVDEPPTFPDGDVALHKWLEENMKYPEEAKKLGIQGHVYTTFVIEPDGSKSNVVVVRGIGTGCDEEAIRLVKAMPKWSPGKQHGQPVRVQYNLSIKFTLQ